MLSFMLTREDSSEVAFLLVENYNYDRSSWSSDRLGIFVSHLLLSVDFSLIYVARREIEEEHLHSTVPRPRDVDFVKTTTVVTMTGRNEQAT